MENVRLSDASSGSRIAVRTNPRRGRMQSGPLPLGNRDHGPAKGTVRAEGGWHHGRRGFGCTESGRLTPARRVTDSSLFLPTAYGRVLASVPWRIRGALARKSWPILTTNDNKAKADHGRTASCPAAPVQIPACGTTARGSSKLLASHIRQRWISGSQKSWQMRGRSSLKTLISSAKPFQL
jgi:hypothetical protein